MSEELKLSVTIDQYFVGADEKVDSYTLRRRHSTELSPCRPGPGGPQEGGFRPSLWLVVDPNLVIPCPEGAPRVPPECPVPSSVPRTPPAVDYSTMDDSEGNVSSGGDLVTEEEGAPLPRAPPLAPKRVKGPAAWALAHLEVWPRPPINYCNLISLALRNSEDGSLNVQQIYSSVREHFPFFRAAPDGWKNTVRHNLCFSSSFEKSAHWLDAGDGSRRSCLWKMTRQGRRKFRTEMQALPDDLLRVLRRSMNKPALMEMMFGL